MPKYDSWTVEIRNIADVFLVIDDKDVAEFLNCNVENKISDHENELKMVSQSDKIIPLIPRKIVSQSDRIISLLPTTDGCYTKVCLGRARLNLHNNRFKKTTLFDQPIDNTDELIAFWKNCGDFLVKRHDNDNRESFRIQYEDLVSESSTSDENSKQSLDLFDGSDNEDKKSSLEALDAVLESDLEKERETSPTVIDEDEESLSREGLLNSIRNKKVAMKFMDIFDLKEPPQKFQVRDVDSHFVNQLTDMMLEKQSISIDNAPTVVGVIDIDKSQFKEEEFPKYKVYIVDGNHSIQAQKMAYRKTKNVDFRYRTVNIYCGLTQEEALFLGISRNEDTKSFTKFSDFQKIDLLRRQLYQLTNTSEDAEPPKATKAFRELFKSFLNLKGKSDVSGKNILKFLSTLISTRNYKVFKDICIRKCNVPASKFDCLRGLSEEDMFIFLTELQQSNLEKEDWQKFTSRCLENQNKKTTKQRKDVTAAIHFMRNNTTRIFIGNKAMVGNIVCFKFSDESGKMEQIFTHSELKQLILSCKNEGVKLVENMFSVQKDWNDSLYSDGDTPSRKFFKEKQKDSATDKQKQYVKKCLKETVTHSTPLKIKGPKCVYSFGSEEEYSPDKHKGESDVLGSSSCKKANSNTSDGTLAKLVKRKIVDDHVFSRIKTGRSKIAESEVEIFPHKLMDEKKIMLDPSVQAAAKIYFDTDAWSCVLNTLNTLQDAKETPSGSTFTVSQPNKSKNSTVNEDKTNSEQNEAKESVLVTPRRSPRKTKVQKQPVKETMGMSYVRLTNISTVTDLTAYARKRRYSLMKKEQTSCVQDKSKKNRTK